MAESIVVNVDSSESRPVTKRCGAVKRHKKPRTRRRQSLPPGRATRRQSIPPGRATHPISIRHHTIYHNDCMFNLHLDSDDWSSDRMRGLVFRELFSSPPLVFHRNFRTCDSLL